MERESATGLCGRKQERATKLRMRHRRQEGKGMRPVEVREQEWLDYRKDNLGKRIEYQPIS